MTTPLANASFLATSQPYITLRLEVVRYVLRACIKILKLKNACLAYQAADAAIKSKKPLELFVIAAPQDSNPTHSVDVKKTARLISISQASYKTVYLARTEVTRTKPSKLAMSAQDIAVLAVPTRVQSSV